MPRIPQPDYVIEAVTGAYQHLGQPARALALYRQGLRRSPANAVFAAGEIRSLADLGELSPAITVAEADLQIRGERPAVLLAAGYAATKQKLPVEALRYIDRALKQDPGSRAAMHDRILAIDEMGAPQVARQLADQDPGLLSANEARRIDGNAAADLVRWGVLEPPNEEQRFAASDRAIAALDVLITRWMQEGDAARDDVLRARFDRMIAYRDRVRMADVLAEYDDLRRRRVVVPGYVQVAVADAYLYLRQPELARDLYLRALEVDPDNQDTRLALFFAYVELEDFDAAYRQADTAAADQPVQLYLKGLKSPIGNPERATADIASAQARLFAGDLAEAHRRMAAMAEAAPNNTRFLTARANIYSERGWPRLAAEEYEISRALKPLDVATEAGQARNALQLREWPEAESVQADLVRRFPENREARRLERLWQVHDMAEFDLTVERGLRSATSVQGGSGLAVGARLSSQPIDYDWRLFASEYVAHEKLPEGEDRITLRRSGVGAEYSGRDLVASLEGTISSYGPEVGATLRSGIDQGEVGIRAQASWSVDDYWQVGGDAELFSRDTPLRALRNGITANAASANLGFRESELSAFRLDGRIVDFSDGNLRTSLAGEHTRRLYTEPHLAVDGIFGLAGSQNSADDNRPYFNPSQDALATAGVSVTQAIYRRYEFSYDHHLVVTPGAYWQQGFGGAGVGSVLYEHRLRSDDVLEAGLGVNLSRQPYDGVYENAVAILFSLRLRFQP